MSSIDESNKNSREEDIESVNLDNENLDEEIHNESIDSTEEFDINKINNDVNNPNYNILNDMEPGNEDSIDEDLNKTDDLNDLNDLYEENGSNIKEEVKIEDNPKSKKKVKKPKNHKGSNGSGKRILAYVLIGIICTSLGGIVSSIATIKYYNKQNQNQLQNQITAGNKGTSNKTSDSDNSSSSVPLSVANVAKKVGPAVVCVTTKSMDTIDKYGFPEQQEGVGSGIIFNEEGYILTNYHVVSGANQINIIFNTGDGNKEIPAKLVNYDANMDVAVLKITEKVTVPGVAEFGDSDKIEVGEAAIAIGNPLGKEFLGSVTSGVVSALNREIGEENQKQKYIQTDAAINPGNSGGALVNAYGQVIGINTAKIGGSQVEGMGFAIPINSIKPKIEDLIKPLLKIGIMGRDIDSTLSKRYNIPVGVYVQEVQNFSPAEKGGIKPGDVIVKFDGKTIKTTSEMNELKQKHKIDDTVNLEVIRDGKNKTVSLKLSEY